MAASFRAIVSAASMPNRSLLCVLRFETSWRHDACRRCRHRRRNRSRRRGFLLDVISPIDRSRWPLWSYGRHEAPLPARKHTTISQHARQQGYGASQCGAPNNAVNLILRLFCGTCLHTTSDDDQTRRHICTNNNNNNNNNLEN